MLELVRSSDFDEWLRALRDLKAKARIIARLRSASAGNFGDCKPVGEGISEMRVHVGAGYRIYFMQAEKTVFVLLCGGDKASQQTDIASAKRLARDWRDSLMKSSFAPFDPADYLNDLGVIAEYLSAAAEDPNPDVFIAALGDVARARGMAHVAKESGLGRESLYKALSSGAHPRYETVSSVLHALGLKLAVVADENG